MYILLLKLSCVFFDCWTSSVYLFCSSRCIQITSHKIQESWSSGWSQLLWNLQWQGKSEIPKCMVCGSIWQIRLPFFQGRSLLWLFGLSLHSKECTLKSKLFLFCVILFFTGEANTFKTAAFSVCVSIPSYSGSRNFFINLTVFSFIWMRQLNHTSSD